MAIQTLCELFYASVDGFKKPEQLRYKRDGAWRGISSDELRAAVEEVAAGLEALGIAKGDHVAILSENRPEWAFADMAVLALGAADVPIYPTLPAAQVRYILKDSESKAAFVSSAGQAAKIAELRGELPELRQLIAFDAVPGTLGLEELRVRGREALEKDKGAVRRHAASVSASDLATIIYTSGTTGDPKGVMLSHANLVSNALGAASAFPEIRPEWVCLSFLPLCHVFERTAGHNLMLHAGVTIAYAESVERVVENMAEVRPQIMSSVPRLYEKMYARVNEKVAKDARWRRAIFRWALGVGRAGFAARLARSTPGALLRLKLAFADRLVFSQIKARTGGRLRIFVSGGAPLAREIAEFFGAADMLICEGYGLTETSPVIACNRPDRLRPGSVGLPLEGVELKIAEDGEILTRGPHVMQGYYKKPEATREAIDAERYFHTGDIGHLDPEGFLVITDRKKDLIATSGGKKIAPQPIENRLKANRFISEVVIVGNRRNFPAALVVPNYELLLAWAAERGIQAPREELVRRSEVVAHYLQLVREMTSDLAQFEKIKKVALLPKELSQEAGELTPTFKVKRRVVEERYKELIDDLYRGGGLRMGRLARGLYLSTLAFIPWAALVPFPWIHENARWSDALFALACLAWALGLALERRLPRLRAVHAGLLLYLGWAAVSLAAAVPRSPSGPAKLIGLAMLAALFVVTSDLAGQPGMQAAIARTIALSALFTAAAALAGVALSGFGVITPLVGTCGDLLPGPLGRAQAGFPHPNMLASYCVFGYGVVAGERGGLSRGLRLAATVALALTVVLTTARAILGFGLAAAIRNATTPTRRRFAWALAAVLAGAMVGLTVLNPTFPPLQPWQLTLQPESSVRIQTVTSSLATLAAHPLVGSGLGSSPGRRGRMAFDAHFTPLNVAATLGLPALAGLALLLLGLWRERGRPTDLALWGLLAGLGLDAIGQDVEDFRHVWVALGLVDAARQEGDSAA